LFVKYLKLDREGGSGLPEVKAFDANRCKLSLEAVGKDFDAVSDGDLGTYRVETNTGVAAADKAYSVMMKITAPDESLGSEIREMLVHCPNDEHSCGRAPRSLSVSASKYDGNPFSDCIRTRDA